VLTLTNYINGTLQPAASGSTVPVIEPATGHQYAIVPASDTHDINAAVAAAHAAFPAWSATSASDRAALLLTLADLIDSNVEALARAESIDTGKPLALARSVDIPRSAANLRFFATAVLHTASESHDFDGGGVPGGIRALNYTLRKPRGVAGLISPWNLPLYLLTWKIAPALATGNTAVCKPSEVTPATATMLAQLAIQAGLPKGVLNIVHGLGDAAGAPLIEHPLVPAISFTGSTRVGQWIGERCGATSKRVSLEMGGKNAFIVFADADLPAAVTTAVRAGFTNQGQVCLCGSRLLLHEAIADEFLHAFTAKVRDLRVGDPLDPATQQGALTSQSHWHKVTAMVQQARTLGGTILAGGVPLTPDSLPDRCKGGYFFQPTVIEGLDPTCLVEQEEIFGPVVTVQRFRSDDDAVALANGTRYGLAATIFTQHLARAHAVAARLDAGIVWVNCWMVRDLRTPFGGVKQSGVGREGGVEAMKFFTEPKNICIAM
jgi:aminomuconate-semialdehyde/2-hydroxymuconate-6-semialdehyde dehydrogenase